MERPSSEVWCQSAGARKSWGYRSFLAWGLGYQAPTCRPIRVLVARARSESSKGATAMKPWKRTGSDPAKPSGGDRGRISIERGERPRVTARVEEPNNALCPRGCSKALTKAWRSVGSPMPDTAAWVTPLMYKYSEMWSIAYDRSGSLGPAVIWSNVSSKLALVQACMRCALAVPSQNPHGGLPLCFPYFGTPYFTKFSTYYRDDYPISPTFSLTGALGLCPICDQEIQLKLPTT